ncbi:uncharacterized protein JN550_003236 [Neoarthrinium moseri]|uniref:uncharacterized protein n=1 Tax=Neoarthrinium moseri TaxID=1658444 RepID=UPI001FDC51DD|nr:uncharacterized protein JN550_003236 [Neoarthrinium moseri]KAI1873967.1 hypothetical protein JN550_003236 [Neoarthrinium moseri]
MAINVGDVILFTTALFLSGYVIQQRTLRDLRRAIRPDPRPSPKIYLPDRFKQSTTELEDGSIVEIGDSDDNLPGVDGRQKQDGFVVEVRPTVPEDVPAEKPAEKEPKELKKRGKSKKEQNKAEEEEKPISRAERRRRIKQDIMELSQGEGPVYYQRRLW